MSVRRVQCLQRIGENVKKHKYVILDDKDEITIGRDPDVAVYLLSDMISRHHAVMRKKEDGVWLIKDNMSLNGVFINNNKLQPKREYELQDGDLVRFGVSRKSGAQCEFLYQYHKALKLKFNRPRDMMDGTTLTKKLRVASNELTTAQRATRDVTMATRHHQGAAAASCSTTPLHAARPLSPASQHHPQLDQQREAAQATLSEFETKLKEMQKRLQDKEIEQETLAQQLQEEKDRREHEVTTLKQREERLKNVFEQNQVKMKEEMEARMKEELEDLLHVREATLMENLESQRQRLMNEKRNVEERLKKELESEREKDKKLTEELLQQKRNLEKVITNKEVEKRLLESQLNDTRQEKDKQHEEMLRAREDVLSNFAQLMETELQCSICNELFVKATSLNCSHAFCSHCIAQWMRVKKECPQCRAAITTHMRSIVLDSYIDKMVEQFSEDMKKSRQEFITERKCEEEAFNAVKQEAAPARGRGRGRGGRGRGRGARGNVEAAPPPLPEAPPDVIHIVADNDEEDSDMYQSLSSSLSTEDEHDGSDSDEIDGDEGAYFGGYGRCYTCGATGHWANGCPFR